MKLILKNFKKHRDRTFEFPNTGLVLVDGPNNKGKSTILNAIIYVFYGNIRKPCTRKTKSCSVTLEYFNINFSDNPIIIQRTNSPKTISVVIDGERLEDVEAQSKINELIGCTYEEFMISAYVRQLTHANCASMTSSILTLTPSEQLKLIETIAFNSNESLDNNVEEIKLKIKNHRKQLTDQKLITSGKQSSISSQLEEIQITLENEPEFNKKKYSKLKDKINEINNEISKKSKFIKNSSHQLTEFRGKIDKYKDLQNKEDKLKLELDHLEKQFNKTKSSSLSEEEFNKLEKKYTKINKEFKFNIIKTALIKQEEEFESIKANYFQELQEKKGLLENNIISKEKMDTIKDLKEKVEKYNEIVEFVKEIYSEALKLDYPRRDRSETIETTFTSLHDYIKDIHKNSSTYLSKYVCYKCPDCKSKLFVNSDQKLEKLVSSDKETKNEDIKKAKELQKESSFNLLSRFSKYISDKIEWPTIKEVKKYNSLSLKLQGSKSNQILYDEVCNKINNEILDKSLTQLQNNINKNREQLPKDFNGKYSLEDYQEISSRWEKEKTSKSLFVELNNKLLSKNKEYEKLRISLEKFEDIPDKDYVVSLESDLVEETEKFEELSKSLNEYTLEIKQYENIINFKEQEKKLSSQLNKVELELKSLEEQEISCFELENISKKAELLALDYTISNINNHAKVYLNQMFIDESIDVKIVTVKENVSGKLKMQINVVIEEDGEKALLDELSGGQLQKCNLAFLLAINDIIGSNIIMLDESLNNISGELHMDILNYLKQYASDKLIMIISHEAIKGVFDYVLDVEDYSVTEEEVDE